MIASLASFSLPSLLMVLLLIIPFSSIKSVEAFSIFQPVAKATNPTTPKKKCHVLNLPHRLLRATSENSNNAGDDSVRKVTKKKGDSLRNATGIRPSLHPTTINCVAEALMLRSQRTLGKRQNEEGQEIAIIDTSDPEAEPIQIAVAAAGIAMAAVDKRNAAAKTDETTDVFSMEESQTLSGRVVGVVMRMRELERVLVQKVNDAKWVRRYGEEESFGLMKNECEQQLADEGNASGADATETIEKQLAEVVKINPLLRMNRAECLLALFLSTVEQPKLEMLGEDVAGGSIVDFIDADRLEVLTQREMQQ